MPTPSVSMALMCDRIGARAGESDRISARFAGLVRALSAVSGVRAPETADKGAALPQ